MKTYKIVRRFSSNDNWEDEKFLTGGTIYHSFKDAHDTLKSLRKMSSITQYKVIPNN